MAYKTQLHGKERKKITHLHIFTNSAFFGTSQIRPARNMGDNIHIE